MTDWMLAVRANTLIVGPPWVLRSLHESPAETESAVEGPYQSDTIRPPTAISK
jgi:hypothetical protein